MCSRLAKWKCSRDCYKCAAAGRVIPAGGGGDGGNGRWFGNAVCKDATYCATYCCDKTGTMGCNSERTGDCPVVCNVPETVDAVALITKSAPGCSPANIPAGLVALAAIDAITAAAAAATAVSSTLDANVVLLCEALATRSADTDPSISASFAAAISSATTACEPFVQAAVPAGITAMNAITAAATAATAVSGTLNADVVLLCEALATRSAEDPDPPLSVAFATALSSATAACEPFVQAAVPAGLVALAAITAAAAAATAVSGTLDADVVLLCQTLATSSADPDPSISVAFATALSSATTACEPFVPAVPAGLVAVAAIDAITAAAAAAAAVSGTLDDADVVFLCEDLATRSAYRDPPLSAAFATAIRTAVTACEPFAAVCTLPNYVDVVASAAKANPGCTRKDISIDYMLLVAVDAAESAASAAKGTKLNGVITTNKPYPGGITIPAEVVLSLDALCQFIFALNYVKDIGFQVTLVNAMKAARYDCLDAGLGDVLVV